MDILRIAALGTAGVLLGITVKGAKPEFALLVSVPASAFLPGPSEKCSICSACSHK